MKLDVFLQFIVPLTFLGLWAWTALLNRDGQSSPPWTTRGPRRIGPAPSGRSRPRRVPSNPGGRSGSAQPGQRDPMWDRDLDG
ncbi:MAG TPA: hypothetical protein VFF52_19030 [Isosphaeraceae bacterium]|nr:hypothetical protein [Isosphaeraceae bacterium]